MDDNNQWSTSEKEPFLLDDTNKVTRRQAWKPNFSVLAICLTVHVLLFALLGSALVLTVKETLLTYTTPAAKAEAVTASNKPSAQKQQMALQEFGGLPVQHDDRKGPYVICPPTGGHPSTAFDAGCHMDLFANGWVPGPCFDREKHDYFVGLHDYYFWHDEAKQHRVHQEELLAGVIEPYPELFVSFEEHWEHCRYLLNTTQRYAHDPTVGVLDVHTNHEHMEHCIDFIRESRDPYNLEDGVIAYFGYRKCYLPRSNAA